MDVFGFLIAAAVPMLIALVFAFLVGLGVFLLQDGQKMAAPVLSFILVFILVFAVIGVIDSYTTIQPGTIGLVTRYGRLLPTPLPSGLNWVAPFIDNVQIVDITQQSYEMSAHPESSNAQWTDFQVGTQTSDGQSILVSTTTIFRIPPDAAVDIRGSIGNVEEVVENVVKANTRSIVRNEAKLWTAEQLYTKDVIGYQDAVLAELEKKFATTGHGTTLVDFLVRGIKFDDDYEVAIEAKQIAAENIITEQNKSIAARFEADKIANLAEGEARARVERAKGDAESVRLAADAEAYAIEQRGTALKRYPQVIQLEFVQGLTDQWGFLPSEGISWLLPAPNP
jgi:regulator of protease activity HflC (stomatin/prohibitin superfamily)